MNENYCTIDWRRVKIIPPVPLSPDGLIDDGRFTSGCHHVFLVFFFFKLSTMHIVLVGSLLSHRLSQTVVELNNDYIPSYFVKLDQLGCYFIQNWELRELTTTNSIHFKQIRFTQAQKHGSGLRFIPEFWWATCLPVKETCLDMHVVQ